MVRHMSSWRDLAANILSQDDQAKRSPPPVVAGLPANLGDGLSRLRRMPPPGGARSGEVWAQIITDAVTLGKQGWAEQALRLGWHPLDLFGCGKVGSENFESLAVWLSGRRVILLDMATAIATEGSAHFVFYRLPLSAIKGSRPEPIFLWEIRR
jgi:hypothetical protein